jgi:hypothetical protein
MRMTLRQLREVVGRAMGRRSWSLEKFSEGGGIVTLRIVGLPKGPVTLSVSRNYLEGALAGPDDSVPAETDLEQLYWELPDFRPADWEELGIGFGELARAAADVGII